jgi:MFS family permease
VFRLVVGVGNAGLYAVDMPLVQEFMPTKKRGWVGALITTLLPAGSMLGGVAGWLLAPIIGWRGMFLLGQAPRNWRSEIINGPLYWALGEGGAISWEKEGAASSNRIRHVLHAV